MTDTPKVPTRSELVKLLRAAESSINEWCIRHDLMPDSDAELMSELTTSAEALEAARAEPVEAKVERAARAIRDEAFRPSNTRETESRRQARAALRAAGVEG